MYVRKNGCYVRRTGICAEIHTEERGMVGTGGRCSLVREDVQDLSPFQKPVPMADSSLVDAGGPLRDGEGGRPAGEGLGAKLVHLKGSVLGQEEILGVE